PIAEYRRVAEYRHRQAPSERHRHDVLMYPSRVRSARIPQEADLGKPVVLRTAEKIHLTECDEDPDAAARTVPDGRRCHCRVILRQMLADLVARDVSSDDRKCEDAADRIDAVDAIVENEVVANYKRIDHRKRDPAV